MSESQLYALVSQREPVSDRINFGQVRPFCLYPYLFSVPSPDPWPLSLALGRGNWLSEVLEWEKQKKSRKGWMYRPKLGLRVHMGEEGSFNFKFYSFDLNYKRSHVSGEKKTLLSKNAWKNQFHLPQISFGSRGRTSPLEWMKIEGSSEKDGGFTISPC